MAVLNWEHHALIQALLTRGPLAEKELYSIFKAITGQDPGAQKEVFNQFLLKINKELSFIQFDLRACRDQNDGQVYYGVINTVSDEQSKLGTKYSIPQIAFFKGIVEAIAQDATAQGSMSNIDALNIRLESQVGAGAQSGTQSSQQPVPHAFKSFTLSQKEKTLDELVQDKWLCYIEEGKIGVGVRSLLDMRSWFYNAEVPACEVCNEVGLKAEVCPNEDCTVRIHHYCLKKKSFIKGGIVCPSCDTRWSFRAPNAETIEEEDEQTRPVQSQPDPGTRQSQPSSGHKRKRLITSQNDAADATRSGSSQEASFADLPTRRVTRSSARLKQ